MRTALEIYLAIGAVVGLVVVYYHDKTFPALVFALAMLFLILFWPLCIVIGIRRTARARS
jgi:phosphate starvation-inducible membrane PsiE